LRATEEATPAEFDDVWARMAIYQTPAAGYHAILWLAVEGVRPLYRELLRRIRQNEDLFRIMARWTEVWVKAERGTPDDAKRQSEELRLFMAKYADAREPTLAVSTSSGMIEVEPSNEIGR